MGEMSDSKQCSRRRVSFLQADVLSVTAEPLATDFAMFLREDGFGAAAERARTILRVARLPPRARGSHWQISEMPTFESFGLLRIDLYKLVSSATQCAVNLR